MRAVILRRNLRGHLIEDLLERGRAILRVLRFGVSGRYCKVLLRNLPHVLGGFKRKERLKICVLELIVLNVQEAFCMMAGML